MPNLQKAIKNEEILIVRKEFANPMLPAEIRNEAKAFLSACFANNGSSEPHAPDLTQEELEKYVYPMAKVHADDRDKGDKLRKFWNEMSIKVPVSGFRLNISVNPSGKPKNVKQWVQWKWASTHPLVGKNRANMFNNPNYRFYIHDPVVEQHAQVNKGRIKRQAMTLLGQLLDGDKADIAITRIIRLMGMKPDNMDFEQKELALQGVIERDAKLFLTFAKDPDLATKAALLDMVNLGILRREQNAFFYIDELIGATLDQAVIYFKDAANNSTVTTLKARYQHEFKERDNLQEVVA